MSHSSDQILASRYARALFEAATASGALGAADGREDRPGATEPFREEVSPPDDVRERPASDALGAAEAVAGELELAREVAVHPEAAGVFKTPRLGTAQKKKLFRDILGGRASQTTLRFVDLLLERKRLDLLTAAAQAYDKLLTRGRGVVRASIRAARAPSEADLAAIRKRLEAFTGLKVELKVREDPELLAGVLVRMGDWVMDASLAGELARLRRRIS